MKKIRADVLLHQRGLCPSRERAQVEILAGRVLVGTHRVSKSSETFLPDADIRLESSEPYVSRAGRKLARALDHYGIDPTGWHCLDIGASTGGFTDCLLQCGAEHVIALDVGHSQIVWKLRNDPRVTVLEHTNARHLAPGDFSQLFDLIVMDVSFISQRLIHPVLGQLLKPSGHFISLIKPQFEARVEEVSKGGIIRDETVHSRVCEEIKNSLTSAGFQPSPVIPSPITGREGNKEFLIHATKA